LTKTDTSQSGNWLGTAAPPTSPFPYGNDGYDIISDTSSFPTSYLSGFTFGGAKLNATWATTAQAATAGNPAYDLQIPTWNGTTQLGRFLGVEYSSTSFTVNMTFKAAGSHKVAFYICDWNGQGRTETITATDAAGTTALATPVMYAGTKHVGTTSAGTYYQFTINTNASAVTPVPVTFTFTNTLSGSNSILSGVFFN
jgi:hypothetical protein